MTKESRRKKILWLEHLFWVLGTWTLLEAAALQVFVTDGALIADTFNQVELHGNVLVKLLRFAKLGLGGRQIFGARRHGELFA